MFITKTSLPRRTFLRGVGTALALPLLDAMVPAATPLAQTAAKPHRRFGFVYVPHGAIMNEWTPQVIGAGFEFTPILKPLEPFRGSLTVISNLTGPPTANGGGHALAPASWLTGVAPKRTEAEDVRAGQTIDQLIAKGIGQESTLPSLELATEDFSNNVGACDTGYSCAYMNTISWQGPTTPLPMEINPRIVFERLFGGSGTVDERVARTRINRSILDAVSDSTETLRGRLGADDRVRLTEYLDNMREIERRIQRAEQTAATRPTAIDAPIGVPDRFDEHVSLMFSLLTVAFEADLTRVFSFMVARDLSARTYPDIGVPEGHHAVSHHSGNPSRIAKHAVINTYHVELFSRFLEKLRATPDGDGSLFDHSTILYGSGMADGNLHNHKPLPLVLAGGGAGRLRGGRHVVYPEMTPLGNLLVALGQQAGLDVETFGDSTGALSL
jgi:hypothetical protein